MEVKDRAAYETLRRKYDYLTSALRPDDILPSLFTHGLISLTEKQEIECAIRERGQRQGCVKLLDILMSNGSEGAFQKFLDILQNQSHLEYLVPELQSEFNFTLTHPMQSRTACTVSCLPVSYLHNAQTLQLPLLHSLTANRAKMGTSMWLGLEIGYIGTMSRKTALYLREGEGAFILALINTVMA